MRQGTKTMTVKNTLDTMTVAGNEAFKEGFEKTLTAVNDANAFAKENVDAMIASATAAGKGAETLNANAVAFAKKSMEDGVAAAKALSTAKSVQEMVEIQTDFVKSAMDAYLAEINKTTDLYAGAVKASLKPLNDRFAATVELVQSQR
ncbi:MAG: TIGR01841 family phasin [Maricaulaceae bacterium]|nr:TIGR01841 family phasin [Maricaulaceae bacterium]